MICLLTACFASAQLNSVAIVGGGAPGGWPTDPQTDLNQMTAGADNNWTFSNIALSGAVKFRGNNSWAAPYDWGAATPATFPTGTAVVGSGAAITVPTGVYNVTFNSATGAYSFTVSTAFPVISLIGPAAGTGPDDWGTDIDLGTTDGIVYKKDIVTLTEGAVKWRQSHDWMAGNWGPLEAETNDLTGIAHFDSQFAVTIPATGLYNASFNKTTLAYSFTFPQVAIVGDATPGGWPDPGDIDATVMTTTDGIHYTLNGVTLAAGEGKFRRDNSYNSNWGAGGWPTGTGVQDGINIPVPAGTYDVTFDASTGAYTFATTAGTEGFTAASLKVYPNPAQSNWNFSSQNEAIESISIVDVLGKTILSAMPKANDTSVDASGLSNGIYFAKIGTAKGSATIRLVKN